MFVPPTRPRELPTCGQCARCHPGRAFGGDTFCHRLRTGTTCTCHREKES